MVNRPFKDKRPIGPLVDFTDSESVSNQSATKDNSSQSDSLDDVYFESISDLPDSPMLKEYVDREVEYTGLDTETIINSTPVKRYMQRLGVWRQAVDMNK